MTARQAEPSRPAGPPGDYVWANAVIYLGGALTAPAATAGVAHLIIRPRGPGALALCDARDGSFTTEPGFVTCGDCKALMDGLCLAWIGAATAQGRGRR